MGIRVAINGFGRTGRMFAVNHWDVVPDLLVVSKALSGGYIPLGAIITKRDIHSKVFDCMDRCFAHSNTFGQNDLAMAAGLATLHVIEQENLLENATRLGTYFEKRMAKMKEEHPIIGDVRNKGCLLGIELVKDRSTKEPFDEAGKLVYQKAFRKGLAWIPAGHILRMSPPIIMEEKAAVLAMDIIDEAIGETEKEKGY